METHPLSYWLIRTGTTKAALAERLGVTSVHLGLILRSHRWPSYKLAKKIFSITGVKVEALLSYNRD